MEEKNQYEDFDLTDKVIMNENLIVKRQVFWNNQENKNSINHKIKSKWENQLPISINKIIKYFFYSFLIVVLFNLFFIFAEYIQDKQTFSKFEDKIMVFSNDKEGKYNSLELKTLIETNYYKIESQEVVEGANCDFDSWKNFFEYEKIIFHYLNKWNCYKLVLIKEKGDLIVILIDNLFVIFLATIVLLYLWKRTDPYLFWDDSVIRQAIKGKTVDSLVKLMETHMTYIENYHLEEDTKTLEGRQRELYFLGYALITEYKYFPVVRKTYKKIINSLNTSYSELSDSFHIQLKLLETLNYKNRNKIFPYLANLFLQITSKFITNTLQLMFFIFFIWLVHAEIFMILKDKYDENINLLESFDEMISVMSNLWWNSDYTTNLEILFHIWLTMIWVMLFGLFVAILSRNASK